MKINRFTRSLQHPFRRLCRWAGAVEEARQLRERCHLARQGIIRGDCASSCPDKVEGLNAAPGATLDVAVGACRIFYPACPTLALIEQLDTRHDWE